MKTILRVVILSCMLLNLVGCGQEGSLYLPEKPQEQKHDVLSGQPIAGGKSISEKSS